LGRRPLGAILHSSNEPGELSQWLCHDDSTINIVVLIIIIIIILRYRSRIVFLCHGCGTNSLDLVPKILDLDYMTVVLLDGALLSFDVVCIYRWYSSDSAGKLQCRLM